MESENLLNTFRIVFVFTKNHSHLVTHIWCGCRLLPLCCPHGGQHFLCSLSHQWHCWWLGSCCGGWWSCSFRWSSGACWPWSATPCPWSTSVPGLLSGLHGWHCPPCHHHCLFTALVEARASFTLCLISGIAGGGSVDFVPAVEVGGAACSGSLQVCAGPGLLRPAPDPPLYLVHFLVFMVDAGPPCCCCHLFAALVEARASFAPPACCPVTTAAADTMTVPAPLWELQHRHQLNVGPADLLRIACSIDACFKAAHAPAMVQPAPECDDMGDLLLVNNMRRRHAMRTCAHLRWEVKNDCKILSCQNDVRVRIFDY